MRNSSVVLSADDLMLSGELFLPDECDKAFPTVCICHGIPAVPYNPDEKGGYLELAAQFCQAGFATLTFNFRGAGPSQGNIDMMGWTRDLTSAIDFLHLLPEVDKGKICLLGSSGGAAVGIYVAASDPRIYAVATFACPDEFDFIHTGYTAESLIKSFREIGIIKDKDFPPSVNEWFDGFNALAPKNYIQQIAPRPLLLIQGDQDDVVPVKHALTLYERAGQPKKVVILPGAGHRLRLDERAVITALNWFKEVAQE